MTSRFSYCRASFVRQWLHDHASVYGVSALFTIFMFFYVKASSDFEDESRPRFFRGCSVRQWIHVLASVPELSGHHFHEPRVSGAHCWVSVSPEEYSWELWSFFEGSPYSALCLVQQRIQVHASDYGAFWWVAVFSVMLGSTADTSSCVRLRLVLLALCSSSLLSGP